MRIVACNLCQGGVKNAEALRAALIRAEADVVVCGEYNGSPAIEAALRPRWKGPIAHESVGGSQGVAVFAIPEIRAVKKSAPLPTGRCVLVELLGSVRLDVLALYAPQWNDPSFDEFWQDVIGFCQRHSSEPLLVCGDFNLGYTAWDREGGTDPDWLKTADPRYDALRRADFTDAWRSQYGDEAREYSYYPNMGNGFRIDHMFVSPHLAARDYHFDHSWRDRSSAGNRLSDHSAMIFEMR